MLPGVVLSAATRLAADDKAREDMIYDELQKKAAVEEASMQADGDAEERSETVDPKELDEDKPGMGRWYCLVCE